MKKEKKTKKRNRNDFFFVCKHIKFSWGLIIFSLIVGSIQSVVVSSVPDATASLFDGDFSPSKLWGVAQTLLITLVLGLVSYVVRVFAESKSVLAARTSIWEKMIDAKMEYYDENDPASRLSMVTVDAQTFGAGLVQLFVFIPTMVVLLIASLLQLLAYNPKLLMVLWVLIPMHIIYFISLGKYQQKLGKNYAAQIGDLTGYLSERIRNLPMIKSFAAEKVEDINGIEAAGKLYAASRKYNVNIGTINAAYQTLSPVASTVISVLWGAYLLRTGETDISSFLAFSMYIVSINMTFLVVATVWVFMKDFAGRANRVARLLEAPTETAGKKNKGIVDVPTGDIQIRNLTFRYPSIEKPVIDNIGFTIPQGKMTAIVGPSGSGKTTFIKLLERLYAPTEGTITIGGTDIQTLNLESWRRSLSYVVQDAGVFSGTLRQALCYSVDREVTEEELTQVTKTVGLYEYIQTLPDGLDSRIQTIRQHREP
jgi:ATP-binding cassette subfamily B protein AbcA/BmrA